MMNLLGLTYLAIGLAVCHAQFVFPDQYEAMKLEAERRLSTRPTYPQSFSGGSQSLSLAPSSFPWRQESTRPSHLSIANALLPPGWQDYVINLISTGVTQFTLDMDRAVDNASSSSSSRENVLFSPVSLTATLAMVLLASGGKTFEEVTRILGLQSGVDISNHSEVVHRIFGLLIQEFNEDYRADKNMPQCEVAFGIFVQDGYPIRKEFRAVSDKIYKSDVTSVDFSNHNDKAQSIINNWVDDKTMGKIKKLLNEPPNPLSAVIIASALYFNGEWNQHFYEGTKRKAFYIEPNEIIYVDFMYNGGTFPFYEDQNLGLKIIGLPYKGLKVSMYAILPTASGAAALKEIKRHLTPDVIDRLINNMQNNSCLISYPKMELSSTLQLRSALKSLGLLSLFDPRTADLSILSPGRGHGDNVDGGPAFITWRSLDPDSTDDYRRQSKSGRPNFLYKYNTRNYTVEQWNNGYKLRYTPRVKRQSRSVEREFADFLGSQRLALFGLDELRNSAGVTNPGLFADDVVHKVEMTVNERGTEAAAVTGVLLNRSGDYRRFIANRPFLFFIRHDLSKLIWFWGSINRPTPFYHDP
ncbi:PREDICTED: leukocyte elastase inhibitor [Ceratosolen solmsi marchali]|uniref:Leukocyte elastase inhibitor n=1 Tax=Ceratosolen solmsi marchali TaxID=326594 RepID=A0AAJ6VJ76_9HYME|nr:PREDICTED: leukocyte elastase inhibitor [Ceratosolen solmsi marchali]